MTADAPPNDSLAEQSTLGAMLISSTAIAEIVAEVKAEDFYRPAHETIFRTIVDLFSSGQAVDERRARASTGCWHLARLADMSLTMTHMGTVQTLVDNTNT